MGFWGLLFASINRDVKTREQVFLAGDLQALFSAFYLEMWRPKEGRSYFNMLALKTEDAGILVQVVRTNHNKWVA